MLFTIICFKKNVIIEYDTTVCKIILVRYNYNYTNYIKVILFEMALITSNVKTNNLISANKKIDKCLPLVCFWKCHQLMWHNPSARIYPSL